MMKKIFAGGLLMIAALCGLLAACSGSDAPQQDDVDNVYDEYIEAILTDWMRDLSAREAMYEDLDWALSYVEAFTDDPKWDTLISAKAAVDLTVGRMELREAPEWSAPEEAYDYFIERGKDITFIQPELEAFEYNQASMLLTCEVLRSYLMSDIFLLDGILRTADMVTVIREDNSSHLQYLALSTDYLLLELDDAEWTEKVHKSMQNFCPQIATASESSLAGKDQLEAAASSVLDELSDLAKQHEYLLGRSQADHDLLLEYIDQGNDAAIDEMLSHIDGLPTMLPDPGWEVATGHYFWTNEDGSRRYLISKEDLTSPPENYILRYADVTEPEVSDYIYFLHKFYDLDGNWVDGEDDFYEVYFYAGDSVFAVSWSEKGAAIYMLKNPVCLVPEWFIPTSN